MNSNGVSINNSGQEILTEKQVMVLDLLIQNKTSKEIGRVLGISPYTVDQRILLARGKLGVASRNELAARYLVMRKAQSPFDISVCSEAGPSESANDSVFGSWTDETSEHRPELATGQHDEALIAPREAAAEEKSFPTPGNLDHRVGPEVFEGSSGVLWRSGAVIATALLLVMTILGLLAIFDQLNDMLA